MASREEIIAAIATAPGRSGIGVVRVSGPQLAGIIGQIVAKPLVPRRAALTEFRDAQGAAIDVGIALYFPAPHSYTGEDMLELQGHGGPVVLRLILKRCLELGARVAEPGEFTKRAFLNDKLDLAQAESVVDLIDAATTQAARGALRSLLGEFSSRIQKVASTLVELRALIEATLDFPEEEIDFLKQVDAEKRLRELRAEVDAVLEASRQGSLLREGMHIVLAGQPNVGKSSLLNRITGEELAIVTDIPGTTRDTIRQAVDIGGIPAHIIDTAGLREARDPVETLGIARTWAAIEKADLVLLVIDARHGETPADREILGRLPQGLRCIRVMNKSDLVSRAAGAEKSAGGPTVWLSARTGEGVDLLRAALLEAVGWHSSGEGVFMARERHVQALMQAKTHLARAASVSGQLEIMAEELRLAQERLSAVTGTFSTEDLLGEIFSRFCIGK